MAFVLVKVIVSQGKCLEYIINSDVIDNVYNNSIYGEDYRLVKKDGRELKITSESWKTLKKSLL
jgi:hypothetical protein